MPSVAAAASVATTAVAAAGAAAVAAARRAVTAARAGVGPRSAAPRADDRVGTAELTGAAEAGRGGAAGRGPAEVAAPVTVARMRRLVGGRLLHPVARTRSRSVGLVHQEAVGEPGVERPGRRQLDDGQRRTEDADLAPRRRLRRRHAGPGGVDRVPPARARSRCASRARARTRAAVGVQEPGDGPSRSPRPFNRLRTAVRRNFLSFACVRGVHAGKGAHDRVTPHGGWRAATTFGGEDP